MDIEDGSKPYCFNVQTAGCDPAARCCGMDLNKVEFFIGQACWGAVESVSVGGMAWPTSYSNSKWRGATYTTFKVRVQAAIYLG